MDRKAKPRANPAWSGKLTIGTSSATGVAGGPGRGNDTAVIEVAIAAPEILAVLKASSALPIGLYRMEGKSPRQYLAAFPTRTPKPSFHVPSAFGTLVLDP